MSNLVIVESPTKARTLSRFLGKDYRIEATMGHVRDLPENKLGITIKLKDQNLKTKTTPKKFLRNSTGQAMQNSKMEKDGYEFIPEYQIISDRKKRVSELKKLVENVSSIILATDPDREGEAIAWHISELLKSDKGAGKGDAIRRIVFHEITQSAIKEALLHPRSVDMNLVDAQQARRILDRLVGYKLSPLLWNKLSMRWLSAGRVQSVTVRLIVEREREIKKFKSVPYFTIEGIFKIEGGELSASLAKKNGISFEESETFALFDGKYTVKKTTISNSDEADKIIADFKAPFIVTACDKKEIRRFPPPPFMTSTLQQEAGRRFYFSSKKTMQLAQKLYEEGFITYHRTDSFNLSENFLSQSRSFIEKNYGKEYLAGEARRYQTKSKVAQEAHEAIRVTDVKAKVDDLKKEKELYRDHLSLYDLIWKRSLACQAKEAVFDSTTVDITDKNNYLFETQGSVVKFDGFLKILGKDSEEKIIPKVSVGQTLTLLKAIPEEHFTNPPPRYTEASLIKTLEEKGIGRPSTYAPIVSTILDRKYVDRAEKKFIPTELGFAVTDFLVSSFADIVDLPFTALMEDELDEIANGKLDSCKVLSDFYLPFSTKLDQVSKTAAKVKMDLGTTNEKCPQCGSPLVIKLSKYGKFLACSNFPKCRFTKNILEKVGIPCPRCGGDIIVRRTKRGKQFYGCSNYPKCTFAAWKKEDIK